jgi:SAM-dependent methyltransferase
VTHSRWLSEVEEIYEAYSLYHQSKGAEQVVFEEGSGIPESRSRRMLRRLFAEVPLPEEGALLDVGCGNGELLRTFSEMVPRWSLIGTELDDRHRSTVESIEGVSALHTRSPDQIPGEFELITMVHVLEHVPEPRGFLHSLSSKLTQDGVIVAQVPNYGQNPFDLLVADHCTHFTLATLEALMRGAGYEVICVANDWIPKELTIVVRRSGSPTLDPVWPRNDDSSAHVTRSLDWLNSVMSSARHVAKNGLFGLFGTASPATWLSSELQDLVAFFVDEDPNRSGGTHEGHPIYRPDRAPSGSRVFMVLPHALAESIRRRLSIRGVEFLLPPQFPA